ncbi:SDR family NAD(P)-dependent oxidoreductase [Pelistega europaea]|uniref:SDR family oxidoreductase n=1 Tax=Pelistega europaea TaxID=106147 RepID=A0A7Y4LBG7_9BURK|nr:SDR family oxidoreductase [Pelistega europaea]NOL50432.1 SDR family oxidoreductase [Pelistega europaea]
MSTVISAEALQQFAKGKDFLGIDGKVALITGAGNGIGLAIAHAFAVNGVKLVLIDIDAHALQETEDALKVVNPKVEIVSYPLSVTDENAVNQAVDDAVKHYGRIDILINNAGVSMNKPTLELTGEEWRRAIDINVNGVFYFARAVGKYMTQQHDGVILNMASMYGVVAAPERAAYCASKASVAMLTKVLAVEWANQGVRVNAIAPGYIKTALVDDLVARGRMDLAALTKRTPVGRLGEIHEIAQLALFLVSKNASFINGNISVIDGGWSTYSYI